MAGAGPRLYLVPMMRGAVGVVVCGLLLSCGGSSGSATGGSGGTATGGVGGVATGGVGGTGASSGGSSGAAGAITVRLANVYQRSGATSGTAFDIYDDMYDGQPQPSMSGKPIIAGLAFGTISTYVQPRFIDTNGTAVRLTALPAGSAPSDTKDAKEFWGSTDDGSHLQLTVVMVSNGTDDGSLLSGLGVHDYIEKGYDPNLEAMGPLDPPPPTGQGEYLVAEGVIDNVITNAPDYFFFIDDSCTPPLNGNPNVPGLPLVFSTGTISVNDFSEFPASPGGHQISIVAWTDPTTPACADLLGRRQATASVSVAAGQQIATFIYGSSLTDLHLLTGPIAP